MIEFADPDALALAIHVACFAVGAWLGSWFPDIDLNMKPFLLHRSIVTHGFLIPTLLLLGTGVTRPEWADWLIAGFSAGVALHLAFDLFPKKFKGMALIRVPKIALKDNCICFENPLLLSRSNPKMASVLWLFVSVFLCLSISLFITLARGPAGVVAGLATLVALYLYGVVVKKEPVARPLLTLFTLGGVAFWAFSTNGR